MADTEIEVPCEPEITGPIAEWIELLQHPKTAIKALDCIVYVGNALGSANCPAQLKITEIKCIKSSYDRAISTTDGEITILGSTSLQVGIFPCNNPKIPRTEWIDSETCAKYAQYLQAVINKFGRPKRKEQKRKWHDPDLVGYIFKLFNKKKEKPSWSCTKRTAETDKTLAYLCDFFMKHENGAFPYVGQVLLNAIVSIDRKSHLSRHSPIFEATKAQDLDAVIMLLSYDVKVDNKDAAGFTALHYAIDLSFPIIAKTLILFGADHKLVKIKGKSVQRYCLQTAKQSMSKQHNSSFVTSGMFHVLRIASVNSSKCAQPSKKYNKKLIRPNGIPGKKTHLLSLDGGGIRGLVLTTILTEIEQQIPDFFKNIKFVAGTSTGSILALAMCQGKSLADCRNIYFKFKDFVFTRERGINYDAKILEEFLLKVYKDKNGDDMYMEELGVISGKMIISTSVDQSDETFNAAHFKSFSHEHAYHQTYREAIVDADVGSQDSLNDIPDHFESNEQANSERVENMGVREFYDHFLRKHAPYVPLDQHPAKTFVHEAARYTSAAPSYFHSPNSGKYVDGGLLNNNPTMVLLDEWQKCNDVIKNKNEDKKRKRKVEVMQLGAVISIGTGKQKPNENSSSGCECRPVAGGSGGCHDVRTLARALLMLSGEIGKSDGQVVEQSFTLTNSLNGAFFRFTPTFDEEIEMDETDNLTLIEMMWNTKVYMRRQENFLTILKKLFDDDSKHEKC